METSLLHKKISIIITAIEIIDELGIQGLSTREIAKRLGVSEGTLFRHYKSKNDMILAVLDHFSLYDLDIMQSTKLKNLTPRQSIVYFFRSYSEYYENYPPITAIIQLFDGLRCNPELEEKVTGIFENRSNFIKKMVESAQSKGEIQSDLDSEIICNILMGTFMFHCAKWRMSIYKFPLKQSILTAIEAVLDAFRPIKNK